MGVVFPVSREPVPGPSAYQRNYNLFSRWSTPEEMFRLNQTLKERKLHMETLCIVQLRFFSWQLFICCVFFSSLFLKEWKYFASVNVTQAVLISLPFCLHLQNRPSCSFCFVWDAEKKRKRWAPKEQSRRQVPACACVSVYQRVCVRVQQRKWDEKKVRFTLQRTSNLPLFQKLSFLVRCTNRDEGWTWRLNSHSKGLALWNWMCTHQYRVTCW